MSKRNFELPDDEMKALQLFYMNNKKTFDSVLSERHNRKINNFEQFVGLMVIVSVKDLIMFCKKKRKGEL